MHDEYFFSGALAHGGNKSNWVQNHPVVVFERFSSLKFVELISSTICNRMRWPSIGAVSTRTTGDIKAVGLPIQTNRSNCPISLGCEPLFWKLVCVNVAECCRYPFDQFLFPIHAVWILTWQNARLAWKNVALWTQQQIIKLKQVHENVDIQLHFVSCCRLPGNEVPQLGFPVSWFHMPNFGCADRTLPWRHKRAQTRLAFPIATAKETPQTC